jgi:hypothetical protein
MQSLEKIFKKKNIGTFILLLLQLQVLMSTVYFVIDLTSFKLQTNILPHQFISEYGLWSNNIVLYRLTITI